MIVRVRPERTTNVDTKVEGFHSKAADIRSRATASTLSAAGPSEMGSDSRTTSSDPARTTLTFNSSANPAAGPPVEPGTTFATKYRLVRLLGQGAVGAVYLAYDLSLQREVAIKILLPVHAADERIVESFHHEAVAMASVRHPNVVQIYTSGLYAEMLFLVMEYVPGRSVATLIQERFGCGQNIPLDMLLGIIEEASLGLAAMHRQGIFHGDVKPANILIAKDNHVAITDFGLVGSITANHGEGHPRHISGGTPLYIAPELVGGRAVPPEERHLCDIYSLGASVFEMFTGQGPFEDPAVEKILHAHVSQPPPRLTMLRPDLPAALDPVFRRVLAKQPQQRYPTCQGFAFAVNQAVQDRAYAALPAR